MYLRAFHIACFLILFIFNIGECSEILTKQQQWDNLAKEVDSWVDGLNYAIDPGIKDTVIVLNLLGFTTRQSCEGHLDHGDANPWVDFTLAQPEVVALQNQVSEFHRIELKEQYQTLKMKYPNLSIDEIFQTQEGKDLKPAYDQFLYLLSLYQQEAKKNLVLLFDLIDKFYQTHETSADQKLVISIEGIIRLCSYGWKLQAQRSESERVAKLKLYRDEMEAFTKFLKEYFFSSSANRIARVRDEEMHVLHHFL